MFTDPQHVSIDPQHAAVLASISQQTGKSYQELVATAIDMTFAKHQSVQQSPSLEDQRAALADLLDQSNELPICHPQDGLSGRDHDQILYDRNQP